MKINSYKELIVWQKSIDLVDSVYKITKKLPKNEEFCISSQIRRAVVSIPSNIAEGFGRKNLKEYIQFLYIALASCFETETQLIIIYKVFQINDPKTESLLNEIIKMLYSLIAKLKVKIL